MQPALLFTPHTTCPHTRSHVGSPIPCTACLPGRYYDAELRTLLARHTRKRSNSGIDLRAGVLPLPLPEPGDPGRTGVKVADMTWSLRMDHEWVVRVAPLRNRQPAFGFLLQEADRQGGDEGGQVHMSGLVWGSGTVLSGNPANALSPTCGCVAAASHFCLSCCRVCLPSYPRRLPTLQNRAAVR